VSTDLSAISRDVPSELRVTEASDADLERVVEFLNRWATPAQWQATVAVRHMEQSVPEPLRLRVLVDDRGGGLVAVGTTGDGGIFRSGDGSWRLSLRVDPTWRRRGVGSAILARLVQHASANGASRVVTAVRGNEPDGTRFAEAHGFRKFHERIDAYIDVPAFDGSGFPDPDETARAAGTRIASYGELLDEHANDIEGFQRAMLPAIWSMARDVPAPTPMPETPPPFEQARRMFFEGPGIDRGSTMIALRDGAVVGMSVTAVKENGTAYTNFTGVSREQRGKGIALAMKLRAIRALKSRGVKLFGTTNDEQNAAMRGINRKLGYVPDPPTLMYEKKFK